MKYFGWRPALLAGTIILPLIVAYEMQTISAYILLTLWIAFVYWLGLHITYRDLQEKMELERMASHIPPSEEESEKELAAGKIKSSGHAVHSNIASSDSSTPSVSHIQNTSPQQHIEQVYQTAIETFSHQRHDWMNDLQLLYGYIQLGNRERLIENIERIKDQMMADSRVAKLGIPQLVFYLQSFQSLNPNMRLEIEIEDGVILAERLEPEQSEELTRVIQQTISLYEQYGGLSWGECPTLLIMIRDDEQEIQCIFEPEEDYPNPEQIWSELHHVLKDTSITVSRLEDDWSSMTLHILPKISSGHQA